MDEIYQVVINDHEQYSVWPAEREIPLGWRAVGMRGSKDECEAHVAHHRAEDVAKNERAAGEFEDAGE